MAELNRLNIGKTPVWRADDWAEGATVHKWNYYRHLNSVFICLTEGAVNAPGVVSNGSLVANDGWKIVFDGYAAVAAAEAAATKADTAATNADSSRKAIEQDSAVVKTSAQALTDAQKAQGRANLALGNVLADIERVQETLGHYSGRSSVALTAKETGVAISSDGVKVAKSGWAIAEFTAEKGVEYLFKPGTIDGSVCIFAQKVTSKETKAIDYSYTYDDEGRAATAKATYNGATYSYTFSYDEETGAQTIKDASGNVVAALPYQYETTVGTYLPLTRLNAGAELPLDGYCRFMSHFQGNASLTVEVSYKVGSADLTMKVVKDGVFASLATQLGNLAQNIASLSSALSAVEMTAGSNEATIGGINEFYGSDDFREVVKIGGQPMKLYGKGTPQLSVVPDNWKQYDPATGTGYDWTGRPSMLGQTYIDTTATSGGKVVYEAVYENESTLELKWL
jgi:hypothetical protein